MSTAKFVLPIALVVTLGVAALVTTQVIGNNAAPADSLSADELAAEPISPIAPATLEAPTRPMPPIAAADAADVRIMPVPETGYFDEFGRYVLDLMEQDYAYVSVRVETPNGRPVEGAAPSFEIKGPNQLFKPPELSLPEKTNEFGVVEFAVVGREMGLDRVVVEYADAKVEVFFNIISQQASTYDMPEVGEGHLPWEALTRAKVSYENQTLFSEFPDGVAERSGKTARVVGFMMPLGADTRHSTFLLTSHPPGCFFHTPGGPAGIIEVFMEKPVEMYWDPIVLEGRFEALAESQSAVYQLHDAQVITQ